MNTAKLLETIAFSAEKHRHQRRKDAFASPYINHPIALATLLATTGGITDLVVLQAAILHDTLEDTETTFEELETLFGAEVASLVLEVTDDKTLAKHVRKQLQINHAPHCGEKAALVKIADKICNLWDIANGSPVGWSLARQREYFDWARDVVTALPIANPTLLLVFNHAYALKP